MTMGKKLSQKILFFVVIFMLTSGNILGCSSSENYSRTIFLMDTKIDAAVYGAGKKQSDEVFAAIFEEMQRLEKILSRHIFESDVNRINEGAGRYPVKVEAETIQVIKKALEVAELSRGAFDPTVGALLELWGWGTDKLRVPSEEEIVAVLPLVDYKKVEVDGESSTVYLAEPGMKLDLGGIAKGFIVDRGLMAAKGYPFRGLFINAGGDISILGEKPSGEKWRVAVQSPWDPLTWVAVLETAGGSIATSGNYQRYFEEDGQLFHHILNPWDGFPAQELSSVTILAPEAAVADALSTAVFVLGKDKGLSLLESMEGIEGLIIDKEGNIFISSGLKGQIEILKENSNRK